MNELSRRRFLRKSAAGTLGLVTGIPFQAEKQPAAEVVNPCNRSPVSLIIDDSTALINMAHFGIPQFKEIFPDQYLQDWKRLPREIPDSFIFEFGEWCRQQGVRGKFSMVPYPACTGWLHRFIPGWSKQDLKNSLQLVRDYIMPDWDIHPEMISHTRVIDLQSGLPYPEASPAYMENWEWSQIRSRDELAAYISFALRVLGEAGLKCEGITTPGGFGSKNMDNLAGGTLDAVKDVFDTRLAHFFRDVRTEAGDSVTPELFHVSGLDTDDPECSVHIIGCTGDWFGGWDGLTAGNADRFITPDLSQGRMVEVIDSGQPAIMVCHWPGIYYNGDKTGFNILKEVVRRLHEKYDRLIWMKNSAIARYQACRELTRMSWEKNRLRLRAPFPTSDFTIRVDRLFRQASLLSSGKSTGLKKVSSPRNISAGTFYTGKDETILCFDLQRGDCSIEFK